MFVGPLRGDALAPPLLARQQLIHRARPAAAAPRSFVVRSQPISGRASGGGGGALFFSFRDCRFCRGRGGRLSPGSLWRKNGAVYTLG